MLLSNLDRAVLTTLKSRVLGQLKSDLRIAVLGNCQSFDLAYAMKLLNVGASVHHYPVQTKAKITGKMLVRALRTYDHVFLQDFGAGLINGGSADLICSELASTTRYPTLLFGAYHPDSIFINRSKSDTFVSGPIGQHHSALALFAYRAGLAHETAQSLYKREVYETLGYLDLWQLACKQLLEQARSYGLKLHADLINWARRGCFMYTINHPKSYVFFDVARHLLEKARLPCTPVAFEHYAINELARDTVFPVYPRLPNSSAFPAATYSKHPNNLVAD